MSNHSYYVGANVNPDTNSFRNWMEKTNRLIYDLSTGVVMLAANSTGETTSGNGVVNGSFQATTLIAGAALRGGTVATPNTLNISSNVAIANSLSVANGITGDLNGTANNATNLGGQAASYYRNADNLNAGTVPNARLPAANTTQQGIVQIVDGVTNTSITHAASANSVKTAYDAITTAAAAAYANAVAFSANASNLGNGTVPTARLPVANTTVQGITQLADSYANNSQTNPPTAKALNDLYVLYSSSAIPPENLPAANTTQAGIARVIDSVASTNVTAMASANSVKTAYDAAIAANTLAANAHVAAANADYLSSGTVPAARLRAANTSVTGITQLSDSVASTSIALAATANAVKTAHEAALTANTNAATAATNAANGTNITNGTVAGDRVATANSTAQGAVIIVNSISNTSITAVAVANNVKTAYDAAIAANTLAANAHTAAANATYISNGTLAGERMAAANATTQGAVIVLDSVTNTSILIAASANSAKRSYDAAIAANTLAANAHVAASDASYLTTGTVSVSRLPAANTTSAGVTQLVDSIANTSVTIAPTANAVKQTYDKIAVFSVVPQNAAYTILASQVAVQTLFTFSNTTANSYTLANNATQNIATGGAFSVRNRGTANVAIVRAAGVTIKKGGATSNTDITIQNGGLVTFIQEANNEWVATGSGMA